MRYCCRAANLPDNLLAYITSATLPRGIAVCIFHLNIGIICINNQHGIWLRAFKLREAKLMSKLARRPARMYLRRRIKSPWPLVMSSSSALYDKRVRNNV